MSECICVTSEGVKKGPGQPQADGVNGELSKGREEECEVRNG